MKFIHLTDTHVIGGGRILYGSDPARRLKLAVDSINSEHGDAAFAIVTGDLTHWGDKSAYEVFAEQIGQLTMPVHLMVGNHDDTTAFVGHFPNTQRDANGFVQYAFDTPFGRAICLDTKQERSHAGAYCQPRLDWLRDQLTQTKGSFLLFMHHPPFKVGIAAMDAIMMLDAEAFHEVIAPHKERIRHLFFGHVHRAIFGDWRGVSFSCMRGLNHQVALDLSADPGDIAGNLENPAYGVVLLDEDCVTVHMHDFSDQSPRFSLNAPAGVDPVKWQLNMKHPDFHDL